MNAGGQDTVFFTPLLQHDDFFFTNDDKGLVERWVRVVVLVQLQFLDVRGERGKGVLVNSFAFKNPWTLHQEQTQLTLNVK